MEKNKKLISIIIPYYKKRFFIFKTLKSILNQSYKNFEIIIVYDDIDMSDLYYLKKIIKGNKKIKIFVNKKNFGVSKSRNIGIKKSKGKYIAFIDSDDTWKKNKLKTQIQFMEKNRYMISHTDYKIINKNDKIIGYMLIKKLLNYNDLIYSCDIALSTVMINSKIKSIIKFPNITTKEDYILWLSLSKKFKIYGIQKNLTSWRKNNSSLEYIIRKFKDAFIVYSKYEKFNFFKSIFFVLFLSINFLKKSIVQKFNK
tara:strand:- start:2423 stop:3190 length:768 start_codon:yes stop_codon:yes gene_type:complete